jgi:serine/threonine protein kinase
MEDSDDEPGAAPRDVETKEGSGEGEGEGEGGQDGPGGPGGPGWGGLGVRVDDARAIAEAARWRGQFQDIRSLRDTNLGRIVLARDRQRFVILKITDLRKWNGISTHENPRLETGVLRVLNELGGHRGIVQLYDEYDGPLEYISVLEFVDGGDFFGILARSAIPDGHARVYFRQIMEAVQFVHRRGYCHLDIKSENLLITRDFRTLKLCDFGMARRLEYVERGGGLVECEQKRGAVGTIAYMAPEVFAGEQPFLGTMADIWSCGVVLFIILCGIPPFAQAGSSDARFGYVIRGQIQDLLTAWRKEVNAQAVDLMKGIMTWRQNRLTMEQILAHPWLGRPR